MDGEPVGANLLRASPSNNLGLDPLGRSAASPGLDEVTDTAVFAASDGAGAITGAVLNLTCGAIVD